ncbi:hypothetical protein F4810DRAFT_656863 [Camillea tinctor]|nr:hypothetical protein F4810DRAFT_656863 [Camillea tinctor]
MQYLIINRRRPFFPPSPASHLQGVTPYTAAVAFSLWRPSGVNYGIEDFGAARPLGGLLAMRGRGTSGHASCRQSIQIREACSAIMTLLGKAVYPLSVNIYTHT